VTRDVALVTGAASGIGHATARRLSSAGWRVYATDVRHDADEMSVLAEAGCETARLDVTDPWAVRAVVDRIETEAGGIDCLVNNAGVGTWGPVEETVDDARDVFDVNVHGTLAVTRAVLPGMRAQNRGRIVTVTSVLGRATPPGLGVYAASKHALESLTDALRREVRGFGVDVVAVQPGWVRTSFATNARGTDDGGDGGGGSGGTNEEAADDRPAARGSAAYRRVRALDERLGFLEGGRLAVEPERVADVVREAAEADDPRARYAVGPAGRLLVATRLLPTPVVDRGFDLLGRVAAWLD
jgi:NAD(P)-dependent dehydrogenase (short-subunit alcohol dehydrogenase family)